MARSTRGTRQAHFGEAEGPLALPWATAATSLAPPVGAPAVIGVADSGLDRSQVDVELVGFQRFHPRTGLPLAGAPGDASPRLHGTRACRQAADRRDGACPGAPLLVAAVLTQVHGEEMVGGELAVLAGLDWLVEQGAQVIVLPFGSTEPSAAWHDRIEALRAQGIVVVAAIGNRPSRPLYPALHPGVLAVGALDPDGRPTRYSAVAAPRDGQGRRLPGTKPDLLLPAGDATAQGTSFAAARAAGLVARLGPPPPGPVQLPPLRDALRRLAPVQAGHDPLHDTRANSTTQGEDMNENVIARSAEVRPDDVGFRVEDGNGKLVGVLLNTATGSVWLMDSTNLWPADTNLTMVPIPDHQSLELPDSLTAYLGPDSFALNPQAGAPAPSASRDTRYLIKNGSVVLAFIAVDPDGADAAARTVSEYGHPAPDDRLPSVNGKRYLPDATLTMEIKAAGFTPGWSDHRAAT